MKGATPSSILTPRDLKLARNLRELSQVALARRIGIAPSTMCDLESGKEPITPRIEIKLLRALWP